VKETGVPGENHFEIVETKSMPPTHIYMTTHTHTHTKATDLSG